MKVVIILFTIYSILTAQTSLTQPEIQDVLDVHNQARAKVCLPGLVWDDAAASAAQQYINNNNGQCPSDHSSQSSRDSSYKKFGGACSNPTFKYCSTSMLGENIASGSIGYYSAGDLVNLWVEEKSLFSCGKLPSFQYDSGHYSQVVWKDTTKVGCGIRDCPNGFTTLLCNYYPPGNFNSQSTLAFPAENCNGNCNANIPPVKSSFAQPSRLPPRVNVPQVTRIEAPSSFSSLSSNWSPLVGSLNDWSLVASNSLNHQSSALGAMTLIGSTASTNDGYDVFIVADINPGSSSKYGLAINAKSGSNGLQFHSFRYDSGVYKICYAYASRAGYDCCGTYKDVPPQGVFKMRHTITGSKHYYRGYIGEKALSNYVLDNTWGGGDQGITANGNANFNSFYVRTPVAVKFSLSTCAMSSSDIINLVSSQLGISSCLVCNVQKLGCQKKRDVQVESISVIIVGSESSTALELANQLVSNPGPSMSSVSIQASSIGDVIAEAGSAIPLAAIPLESGLALSIGAISGIVAGCVAGVVAVGVGIYFATKSKKNTQVVTNTKQENVHVEVEVPGKESQIPTPKVRGVDVFNLDPNNPQSITARNPNIVHNAVNN
jgi:pathogenesis-related protein 1